MKNQESNVKKVLLLLLFATSLNVAFAQKDKQAKIKELVESKHYVFTAQSMTPTQGGFRSLTSQYDVTVSDDSVIAFLPYIGRAYSAPIDPSDGPIRFTSTNFSYTQTAGRKNSWEVEIKPKDVRNGEKLFLTIFDNGAASLRVTSNNRQPITFNGYITKEG